MDPDHVVGKLERVVLAKLGLKDVAVAHVRVSGNVDRRDAPVRRTRRASDPQVLEKIAVDVLGFFGPEIVDVARPEIIDQGRSQDRGHTQGKVPARVVLVGPEAGRGGRVLRKGVGDEREKLLARKVQEPSKHLMPRRQLMVHSHGELVGSNAPQADVDVVVLARRRVRLVGQGNALQNRSRQRIDS